MADSKSVDTTLKNVSSEEKASNQQIFDEARKRIDFKTMKDVQEVTAPPPKAGPTDPWGAANTRLDPATKEKIEAIQKARTSSYTGTTQPNVSTMRVVESANEISNKAVGAGMMSSHQMHHSGNGHLEPEENNLEY